MDGGKRGGRVGGEISLREGKEEERNHVRQRHGNAHKAWNAHELEGTDASKKQHTE